MPIFSPAPTWLILKCRLLKNWLSVRMSKNRIILAVLKLAALISFLWFCFLFSFCGHMRVKSWLHWSWWVFCYGHQLGLDFSTMKRSHLLHFLQCCWVAFNAVKLSFKEPHSLTHFRVSAVSVRVPALHLRFQGWLLCFPVASMTRFLWKFCLCAFGLSLETIFGSFQNVPEVPFTPALVQRV